VRHGRGMSARRQLRAPDCRLRLGFAGEAAEELSPGVVLFGVRAGAIKERRALLLGPAFERIRHGSMTRIDGNRCVLPSSQACAPERAASIRAITSGVSF